MLSGVQREQDETENMGSHLTPKSHETPYGPGFILTTGCNAFVEFCFYGYGEGETNQ